MKYNSPFIKFLEMIANMLIVSFFWIVCSIPILTIIPASSALYHTTNKIIFNGNGKGVLKDYFESFKTNFVLGFKLNLICLVAAFFIIVGLNTGFQIYKWNTWGVLYLILGFLITFVCVTAFIYLPAVVSRFYLKVLDTIKLAVYFASQNILISILNVLLLALIVFGIMYFPLLIVIAPALYVDLIRINIEKKMNQFIKDNNLEELIISFEDKIDENKNVSSFSDINDKFEKNRRDKNAKN